LAGCFVIMYAEQFFVCQNLSLFKWQIFQIMRSTPRTPQEALPYTLRGNYRPHTSWPSGALSQTATSDSGPGPRMCHYHLSRHRLYAITQHPSTLLSVVRSPYNRACVYIPSLAHESVNGQAFVGSTHCLFIELPFVRLRRSKAFSISFVNRPIFRTLCPEYSLPLHVSLQTLDFKIVLYNCIGNFGQPVWLLTETYIVEMHLVTVIQNTVTPSLAVQP
jgi:hypothetical protein